MNTTIEIIETTVTTAALAAYLTADYGETFGIYADKTFAVGESIGDETAPDERPIATVKCPGLDNIDTSYFTDDFVTYNEITAEYESIEQDRDGTTETYTLAEVIQFCCEYGDMDVERDELIADLIAGA